MNKKFSKLLGVGLAIAVLASLFVFAVPALATISAPAVTVTPTSISANAQYVIKFDTYFALTGGTTSAADYITVVFPSGTTVPTGGYADSTTSNISVAKDGNLTSPTYYDVLSANLTEASRTYVIRVPSGATTTGAAHMAIKFATGATIYNPGTAGSYILTVKTSQETTAVDSTAYTISTPVSVSRYNKAGNFVGTYSTIQAAIDASVDYDTLKLSEGTYPENVTVPDGLDYLTIISTGTAAATIIGGTASYDAVSINGTYTTIDTVTIKGTLTLQTGGDFATIQNSTLTKRSSTSAATLLTSVATDLTVQNSTIDLTSGSVADTGVKLNATDATAKITSVTFKLDSDTGLVSDKAIQTSAGLATATNSLVVATSTFTGSYGIGYSDAAGSVGVVIKTSTFDGLEQAINIAHASANATIQGNTIKNSVLSGTGTAALGTIAIGANAAVTVEGNAITDNKGYSIKVTASADKVKVNGNSLSGNTMGLRNTDSANTLNAELNWWGATTGPTHATYNPTGTGEIISDYVDAKPFLTASTSGANAARIKTTTAGTASSLDASTTAGIAVDGVTTAAAAQIVLSKLGANPQTVAPAYTALAGAYFDIYISAASSTTVNAKFYATGITSLTQAYFWSGLQGKWVAASEQGVSGAGDFVWANIKAVGATNPTVPTTSDLTGTAFVLVAAPAAAPVVATISLTVPAAGAVDKAITNLPFTWASVAGATSYSLVISANADLSSPVVTATAAGTAYTYTGTLGYSTPYYWQVTALKDTTTTGKSDIATFVTVAKPVVVVVPPVVVPPVVVTPISIVSPAVGAVNVSVNPILTWTPYEKAISYEIVVATDSTFKIIDYSHNVPVANTFYASEPLAYGTTYYWRVRGVTGPAPAKKAAPGGDWATGIFTTEPKPVVVAPPVEAKPTVIVQKEPGEVKIVEVPVPTVVPQPIPSYLLWIIIGIGAVLIIALIVLIVRTRRVA